MFQKDSNTERISSWKSKGLLDKSIKTPVTSENSLTLALNYISNKIRVNFDGGCLKQGKITFTHKKTVTIYIVYQTNLWNYITI